jgi:RNA polymerase sigma-70 factor (ECF subfamily)
MTDEDLLAGLKAGEPKAFEELFRRFESPLYRFFLLSHGNHHLAEDQCADTFVALATAIHRIRGGTDRLRGFVFGVARNVLRRSRRRSRLRPMPLERAFDVPDPRAGPFRNVAGDEALRQAMSFIEAFDEPVRQVLILRFVEGLALEEVAQALSMPLNTVKSRVHRARKRLREQIAVSESGKKANESHE